MKIKINQQAYPALDINNEERDHVQIWNNEEDAQVIHIEYSKIDEVITALQSCKKMTSKEVVDRDYAKIKGSAGELFAKKYFNQVDRLLNPNSNNITEYRVNGVVTDDSLFHALADTDLKKWRIAFVHPVNTNK